MKPITIPGLLILAGILTACGGPDNTVAEQTGDAGFFSPDQAMDAADESFDAKSDGIVIHHVSQYVSLEDNVYLDDEKKALLKTADAVETYDAFLQEKLPGMYGSSDSDVRMALGWVDEDDVPELFLCQSDATASGVSIYSIDEKTGQVRFLGEFSQFGNCVYTERGNRIWSQYGNQGYYRECVSMIKDGEPGLIGGLLLDGSGVRSDEVLYYADFPIPDGRTGTRVDMDTGLPVFDTPDEQYRVDEKEYVEAYHSLMRDTESGAVKVVMDYASMVTIRLGE